MDPLISTQWLEAERGSDDLRIVDATVFLPGSGRSAAAEFAAAHIPGAVFMDLDRLVDPASPLPHMLSSAEDFAAAAGALGLTERDRIVVYDNSPLHSAARGWWMLRHFGARQVAVLDGGLAQWLAEGRAVEAGQPSPVAARFAAEVDSDDLADKATLLSVVRTGGAEILDARGAARFAGREPEPRPGVAAGHIPGARNLPQGELFAEHNRFKRGEALSAAFAASGVDLGKPLITSCGSGVTAAVLLFGALLLGKTDVQLYDGSWSEWGADPDTPKAIGEAPAPSSFHR